MTTLKITVDNKDNARLLTKILKNMRFVKQIEEEKSIGSNQYSNLRKIFSNTESDKIFQGINDPVQWQKNIRDEWETS